MNRILSFVGCVLYCGVLVCRRHVVAHGLHAAGEAKKNKFVSFASFFSLPRIVLPARHYHQTRAEQRERQRVSEGDGNQGARSALASCDSSVSLLQKPAPMDYEDPSCIVQDNDIGSTVPPYREIRNATLKDCLIQCRRERPCTHFTWNKKSRKCYTKGKAPDLKKVGGDITGSRSCDTRCFVGCVTYNTNPIKTYNWGAEKGAPLCQVACFATSDCRAFVIEGGKCKLFGAGFSAYRTVSGGNTIAGPKQFCDQGGDLRLQELNDGHAIGSCLKSDNIGSKSPEVRNKMTGNARNCQQVCERESYCNHWTFSTRSKICYLKKDMKPAYYATSEDMTGDKHCRLD